jgi:chromosome segregation ATPase
MNLENQGLLDDLNKTINSALEFLNGKESRMKKMEEELTMLESEINFDSSKGLNVDKKKIKLKDLEDSLYEYEVRPSDVLIECTHINNINNCMAKINGERIHTYGEAKLDYENDLKNKSKLSLIVKDIEKEFSKINDENEVKKELREKIVKSEMHINGLDSRIKLYEHKFSDFTSKEKELKSKLNLDKDELNKIVSLIEIDKKELDSLVIELDSVNEVLSTKNKQVEELININAELKEKSTNQGPIISNDINNNEKEKLSLEVEIKGLKSKLKILIKNKKKVESKIKDNNSSLNERKDMEPFISSNINFINTLHDSLEYNEDVNDLWKSMFKGFNDKLSQLSKDNNYPYLNVNGEENNTLNPLINSTERLQKMIDFIKENDLIIEPGEVDNNVRVVYKEKEKENKLNPIVIGAIALGGVFMLSKVK